jgi:enoyl-CoA hydratase/carnithine racemase
MCLGPPVRYEQSGEIVEIVIDSPPLNLFTHALERGLVNAVARAHTEAPAAVVIRADGANFTAGVDVQRFVNLGAGAATELFPNFSELIHAIEELPCPTLSLAHGLCLTSGFEICLACDFIWAGASARFGLVEHRFAITPALGGTQRIAQRAGVARAKELVMSADIFDAPTLERWNIINRVVPDANLRSDGLSYIGRLAGQPRQAVLATKRILSAYVTGGVRAADHEVAKSAAPLFGSEQNCELARAFLDRNADR